MWWHEVKRVSAADAHYTHPRKYEVLHPPGFLYQSMLSCSQLFVSYLVSLNCCRFQSKWQGVSRKLKQFSYISISLFNNTFISSGLFFCYISECKIHCSTGSVSHLCLEHICSIPVYCFHHLHLCYRGTSGYNYNYKRCRFYSQCRTGL